MYNTMHMDTLAADTRLNTHGFGMRVRSIEHAHSFEYEAHENTQKTTHTNKRPPGFDFAYRAPQPQRRIACRAMYSVGVFECPFFVLVSLHLTSVLPLVACAFLFLFGIFLFAVARFVSTIL